MIPYLYVFNAIIMIISRKCVTLCSAGEYDLGLVVGIMPLAKKLSIYLEMGRYHDDRYRYRYFVLSIADTDTRYFFLFNSLFIVKRHNEN